MHIHGYFCLTQLNTSTILHKEYITASFSSTVYIALEKELKKLTHNITSEKDKKIKHLLLPNYNYIIYL